MKGLVSMDMDQYQLFAERTSRYANSGPSLDRATMATWGIVGESGELVDTIKKILFHDHPLNTPKLPQEIGDVLWYLAELCTTFGISLNEVAKMNIGKLAARYGTEFSSEKSINRSE